MEQHCLRLVVGGMGYHNHACARLLRHGGKERVAHFPRGRFDRRYGVGVGSAIRGDAMGFNDAGHVQFAAEVAHSFRVLFPLAAAQAVIEVCRNEGKWALEGDAG